MKLLYITDEYKWAEHGVKRAYYDALAKRVPTDLERFHGDWPQARYNAHGFMGEGRLFDRAASGEYSHVLFVSSDLSFRPDMMTRLRERARLVGFWFSNPLPKIRDHWRRFDDYVAVSRDIVAGARRDGVNAILATPAIVAGWSDKHQADQGSAAFDVVFPGAIRGHVEEGLRQKAVDDLRAAGLSVHVFSGLHGEAVFREYARGKIGLNVTGPDAVIPHRLFEYAACGLCILTTITPDVRAAFEPTAEVMEYGVGAAMVLSRNDRLRKRIAAAGHARVMRDHTVDSRVETILQAISQPHFRER